MLLECEICDECFTHVPELEAHKRFHDPSDRISCRRCGHLSTTLKRHRKHSKYCYPCQKCGMQFRSEASRTKHECFAEFEKALTCGCGRTFETYSAVVAHAKGPRPLYCCRCDFTSRTLTSLVLHYSTHSTKSSVCCAFCSQNFSTRNELKLHTTTSHLLNDSTTKCDDCGKNVPLRLLATHRARHNISCLCPECGQIFDSPKHLGQHLANKCRIETMTCDLCKRVLKSKKILTEHLKTHMTTESGTRVPQAICPHCGLELAQKGSLQRHILVVHEKHKLQPKEAVPRMCEQCGLTLPSIAKYYTHQRQHRAELERHECEICARAFNKRANLLRHVHLVHERRVGNNLEVFCQICMKQFKDKKTYTKHFQQCHQNDTT